MEIRVFSHNIHKGVGWRSRKSTYLQLRQSLIDLDADILFLQEILLPHFEDLRSHSWSACEFGKNGRYKNHYQGNAIFSKSPLLHAYSLDLSMHRYEHRSMLHVYLESQNVHLLCVHLGLFAQDRIKQIAKILDYIAVNIPSHQPVIFAGDFNDWNSKATRVLLDDYGFAETFHTLHKTYARSYPAWSPFFKLDRIYYKHLRVINAYRLVKKPWKDLSDHIGLTATFEL